MDKGGYLQPATADMEQDVIQPADLDKWAKANRDIWRLVRITGATLADAKQIVIGSWDLSEKTRFESWVRFFEAEDDKKYKGASFTDCDISTVKTAALKMADSLSDERREAFRTRLESTDNVKTVVDYIRAMRAADSITKTAADDDTRSSHMFNIIREIQDELSKKKLVRNLARVLAMDRDGMFPEVPQALAKLIEAYQYSTTRIQDVMGRLGLQLSMMNREEAGGEDKLSKKIEGPKVAKIPAVKEEEPEPVRMTPKEKPVVRPTHKEEEEPEPMLPRVENRGI